MINMQTFQTNIANIVLNSIMNYQAPFQQALHAQFNLFELSLGQQIGANSRILNAHDAAPSCSDIPRTSTTHADDTKLAAELHTCNRTQYLYSTTSTRSISINISPRNRKITSRFTFILVFGYVSLSNFWYVDPPVPQPHRLNLPPSRAKRGGYSHYSLRG
jgi:hypothetical protein